MKVSEARAAAKAMQDEATHLMRAASALNEAADRHRLNNTDHSDDSDLNASEVGKALDDNARARVQKALQEAQAHSGSLKSSQDLKSEDRLP